MLRGETTEKTQFELSDVILAASERMLKLINDLLDMSKIRSGRLDLNLQEVDIAELIARITAYNKIIGQEKNITFRQEVSEDIGSARLDPERFQQMMDNLIGNAIKFSNSGTTITVGARKTSDNLLIWWKTRASE